MQADATIAATAMSLTQAVSVANTVAAETDAARMDISAWAANSARSDEATATRTRMEHDVTRTAV
jgi:hypothetical protein